MKSTFYKHSNILLVSILTLFVCLGLARFLYGMMLPFMQNELDLLSSQAGLIGSMNFVGYMGALFFSNRISRHFGNKKMALFSLYLISLTLFLIPLFSSLYIISILYLVTGVFSALANVAITVIITHTFDIQHRGKAVGVMVMGNGIAIITGGLIIPRLHEMLQLPWQASWFFIATLSMIVFLIVKKLFSSIAFDVTSSSLSPSKEVSSSLVYGIGSIYFIFGFSYSVYVTFFISSIIQSGQNAYFAGYVWMMLGFFSLFSGIVFGALSDTLGRAKTIALVYLIQSTSYFFGYFEFSLVSAMLFGLTAWSVPSIISAMCADVTSKELTASLFSKVTLFFGIGQILGPLCGGYLIDITHTSSHFFVLIGCVTFIGALLAKRFD